MTGYIPRTGGQKKKNILRQKELELCGDIRRQATNEKLERSAEKVRSAQLGVVKALFVETRPVREEDEEECKVTLQKLQAAKEYWESVSVDEIVRLYSTETDHETYVDRKKW